MGPVRYGIHLGLMALVGVGLLFVGGPLRVLGLVFWAIITMALIFWAVASPIVDILGRQRHRLYNHLQVLSGWLELGRPDRAQIYIQNLMDDSAAGDWIRPLPAWIQLLWWYIDSLAEARGIPLQWTMRRMTGRLELMRLLWVVRTALSWALCAEAGAIIRVEASPGNFRVVVEARGPLQALRFWCPGVRFQPSERGGSFLWEAEGSHGISDKPPTSTFRP